MKFRFPSHMKYYAQPFLILYAHDKMHWKLDICRTGKLRSPWFRYRYCHSGLREYFNKDEILSPSKVAVIFILVNCPGIIPIPHCTNLAYISRKLIYRSSPQNCTKSGSILVIIKTYTWHCIDYYVSQVPKLGIILILVILLCFIYVVESSYILAYCITLI